MPENRVKKNANRIPSKEESTEHLRQRCIEQVAADYSSGYIFVVVKNKTSFKFVDTDHSDIEDYVQQVVARLLADIHKKDNEEILEKFLSSRGYRGKVYSNVFVDFLRSSRWENILRNKTRSLDTTLDIEAPTLISRQETRDLITDLEKITDRISDREDAEKLKDIFLFIFMAGHSASDLAKAYEVTPTSICSMIKRLFAKYRDLFADHGVNLPVSMTDIVNLLKEYEQENSDISSEENNRKKFEYYIEVLNQLKGSVADSGFQYISKEEKDNLLAVLEYYTANSKEEKYQVEKKLTDLMGGRGVRDKKITQLRIVINDLLGFDLPWKFFTGYRDQIFFR